jgi:transposase
MGAPYSEDLRWKVVEAYEREEGSMRVLAKRFSVGLGFVRDVMTRPRLSCASAGRAWYARQMVWADATTSCACCPS